MSTTPLSPAASAAYWDLIEEIANWRKTLPPTPPQTKSMFGEGRKKRKDGKNIERKTDGKGGRGRTGRPKAMASRGGNAGDRRGKAETRGRRDRRRE